MDECVANIEAHNVRSKRCGIFFGILGEGEDSASCSEAETN
jgi:hypothetical protein